MISDTRVENRARKNITSKVTFSFCQKLLKYVIMFLVRFNIKVLHLIYLFAFVVCKVKIIDCTFKAKVSSLTIFDVEESPFPQGVSTKSE